MHQADRAGLALDGDLAGQIILFQGRIDLAGKDAVLKQTADGALVSARHHHQAAVAHVHVVKQQ